MSESAVQILPKTAWRGKLARISHEVLAPVAASRLTRRPLCELSSTYPLWIRLRKLGFAALGTRRLSGNRALVPGAIPRSIHEMLRSRSYLVRSAGQAAGPDMARRHREACGALPGRWLEDQLLASIGISMIVPAWSEPGLAGSGSLVRLCL